jgi:hypothetical protein
MNDKEWLEKVSIAFKEYQRQFGQQTQTAEFISWLYKQYGITVPKQ